MGVEDVSRAYTLFLDVQRSSQLMVDQADQCAPPPLHHSRARSDWQC